MEAIIIIEKKEGVRLLVGNSPCWLYVHVLDISKVHIYLLLEKRGSVSPSDLK